MSPRVKRVVFLAVLDIGTLENGHQRPFCEDTSWPWAEFLLQYVGFLFSSGGADLSPSYNHTKK